MRQSRVFVWGLPGMSVSATPTSAWDDLTQEACYFFGSHARLRSRDAIDLAVDPPPDMAVEVDMSRSSVDKLAIYAALGVAELWRTDGRAIEILQLGPDGYRLAAVSGLLPGFPRAEAMRLLGSREALYCTSVHSSGAAP